MLRLSMDKRFKIGTTFNICLLTFFGFFAIYHIYSFDQSVKTNLEHDVKWFLETEKNVKNSISLRQRISVLDPFSDAVSSPDDSAKKVLKLRDDCLDFVSTVAGLIGSQSRLIETVSKQTRYLTGDEIASGEFKIRRGELSESFQKLTFEMLALRDRSLTMLTARKDSIANVSKTYSSRIVIVTLTTIILAFVSLYFLSQQIRLPTRKIIEIIRKIRDGNYSIPVRSHTGNEVDQIVAGLASVAENLRVRDQLKLEKIQLEKKRFAALANFINTPLMLVNDEKKVAFANDELMTLFKLTWDELYEVDFNRVPLPVELRDKLSAMMHEKKWVENEACDIIGEKYAFDLHISTIPVKTAENISASIIITLGKIDCRKRTAPTAART